MPLCRSSHRRQSPTTTQSACLSTVGLWPSRIIFPFPRRSTLLRCRVNYRVHTSKQLTTLPEPPEPALPRAEACAGIAGVEVVALEGAMLARILEDPPTRRSITVIRPEGFLLLYADSPAGMPPQISKVPFPLVAYRIETLAAELWCPVPWPIQTPPTLIVMPFVLSSTHHPCT